MCFIIFKLIKNIFSKIFSNFWVYIWVYYEPLVRCVSTRWVIVFYKYIFYFYVCITYSCILIIFIYSRHMNVSCFFFFIFFIRKLYPVKVLQYLYFICTRWCLLFELRHLSFVYFFFKSHLSDISFCRNIVIYIFLLIVKAIQWAFKSI